MKLIQAGIVFALTVGFTGTVLASVPGKMLCFTTTYTAFGDKPVTLRQCADDQRAVAILHLRVQGKKFSGLALTEGSGPSFHALEDGSVRRSAVAVLGDEQGGKFPLKVQIEVDGTVAIFEAAAGLGERGTAETPLGLVEYTLASY
ncbi:MULTISPECIES: hypothetical protein [unclassified Stenotrophomonas]|uniref:hypothetical protein n=1 Tax=unclassified Stenotrophomonas TaxID=196198 RepID=UPI0021186C91|nr:MULTISPECIES: hypothetical protein [unclassified Stenotrophomonas]